MAENEWLNGYLEAILNVGRNKSGREGRNRMMESLKQTTFSKFDEDMFFTSEKLFQVHENGKELGKTFSPTQYFVEEVVNRCDETDLYRTWIKVVATRNSRERNNRLENMCWRIWHLARKKKQRDWEDAQRLLVKRTCELDKKVHIDLSEDLSDLSESEKGKGEVISKTDSLSHMPRINSDAHIWCDEDKPRQLYIVLISIHGLIRGENMELGRDSDTGGQVKYVVELAKALSNMNGVNRVDLLTRQITCPEVDSSYGEPTEMLSFPSHDGFGNCGAYIIRIPCGPRDKYIPKESLWPYIPEFTDGALGHIVNMSRALAAEQGNEGKPVWPYVIHGHYADAGEVAARISGTLNVPMVFTGHSLGRNKFEQLLKQGMLTEDINATYKIIRRIEAEELALDSAEMVVTSTRQEIEEQWGLYDGFDVQLERKLRIRRQRGVSCLGRYMPRMVVIHPGMDFSSVKAQDLVDSEADLKGFSGTGKIQKKPIPHIWAEILKFFTNPHKPMILALSRPDPKKNVMTLLKAFGECRALQELANMTLILGNRDDIEEMSSNTSTVVTAVLKLIDRYNLYGQVAYPKHHKQHEVPDIYRLAAKTKGVFINPAFVEPFGLTLIEAAAYGLPVVATKNGGPVDIIKELNNGLLVDPHDQQGISDALLKLVVDKALWLECRKNGLKNISRFSWPDHCLNYLSHVEHCRKRHPANFLEVIVPATEEPMTESLCGVEDFSLNFSIDADLKLNRDVDMDNRKQELINVLTRKQSLNPKLSNSYFPGRRQALYVVAVDCYDNMGNASEILSLIINNVNQIRGSKSSQTGLVLMTGMSLHEMKEAIKNSQANLEDFDAIACNSGSEMYYPWRDMVLDEDYEMHIEYRWPCENVKSVMTRLAKVDASGTDSDDMTCISPSSSRCYTYIIKAGTKTRRVNDLRQRLRMRGFRCNTVYTHAGLRLNVIPLYASRSQAIRYLSIRWGIDLSRITVFVGESGDTDYADLLMGLHKIIILQDCVECGSHKLLHDEDSIKWKDVTSQNNTTTTIAESYEAQVICTSLEKLGSM